MGRGMLRNIVRKTNAEIVSIHDVSDDNINIFMDSLSSVERVKVRVCGSPADVRHYQKKFWSHAFSPVVKESLTSSFSLFPHLFTILPSYQPVENSYPSLSLLMAFTILL